MSCPLGHPTNVPRFPAVRIAIVETKARFRRDVQLSDDTSSIAGGLQYVGNRPLTQRRMQREAAIRQSVLPGCVCV